MNDDVRYVEQRLWAVRLSKRRFYIMFGASTVLGALCVGLIIFSSIDLHVSLFAWLRAAFFGLLILGALVLIGVLVVVPILRRLGLLKLTWDVEETFPGLDATLATTVEYTIDPYSRDHHTSEAMRAALAEHTRGRITDLELTRSVRWARLRWPALALGLVLVGLVLLLRFVPNTATAMQRVLVPWRETTYTRLDVQPGDAEREELSDLTVTADVRGRIPDEATIHFEQTGGEWVSEPMTVERAKPRRASTSHTFNRLSRTFSYYVEAGDAASPKHTVLVYPDPKIETLTAELVFPSYTELPKQTIRTGDIVALRGTDVTLTANTNTVLGSARLVRDDGTELALTLNDDKRNATGTFVVEQSGEYEVQIKDTLGHRNRQRRTYSIVTLKDTVPDVRIVHPGKDMKVTKTAEIPVEFEAADDFGIVEVGLALNIKMEGEQREIVKTFDTRALRTRGEALIMLEQFPLEAHDIVSYYVYAIDNDTVSGPKQGFSNVYFIEIVPYEEKYRLGEGGEEMPTTLELRILVELIRMQKEIIQRTFSVLNEMTEPVEPDVAERVLEIASLQLENAELADDFAVTFEQELLERGLEHEVYKVKSIENAASSMRNAVDLLEAIEPRAATAPEQQALAALYKALSDLEHLVSPEARQKSEEQEQIRQALELARKKAAERAEQRQQEREEKLKQQESKLDELKKRQQELNKEMADQAQGEESSTEPASDQASVQQEGTAEGQAAASRQKQLGEETKAEAGNLDEMAREDPSLSKKASTNAEKAAEKMQEAAEHLDEAEAQDALEKGREAEELLDKAIDELQRAKERNLARSLERLARDLDAAAREQGDLERRATDAEGDRDELERTSERQDQLKEEVDDLAEDAEALAPRVKQEDPAAGEKVGEASEKLSSGEIQDAMEHAAGKMASGDGSAAAASQGEAREGLREASNLASDALRAMSQTDKEKLLSSIAKAKEALTQQRGINREAEATAADPGLGSSERKAKSQELADKQADASRLAQELVDALEDLARGEEYQPDTRHFREARREMDAAQRSLDAGSPAAASATGQLAAERLAKGLDELEKLYGNVLLDDVAQAVRDADRLVRDQERVRDETAETGADAESDDEHADAERAKTALKQKWVADDAAELEKEVAELVEQSRTAESDAGKRIENARATLGSDELQSDLEASREDIEEGRPDEAGEKQARAIDAFQRVRGDLERAYTILTTSDLERLWESAENLGELAKEVEKLREGEPSDEETAQLVEALDEEADKLGDTARTATAAEHAKAAANALQGEEPQGDKPPMDDRERIAHAEEQIHQALGEVVREIDALVEARRILLPKDETCPPEYQALVEYYYKVLSEF